MENKLTQQESLAVITEMIEQAKNNLQKGSGSSFIYYGYAVALLSVANFVLIYTLSKPHTSFNVWWLMLPVAIVGFFIENRQEREAVVHTKIDAMVSATWRGYFISCMALLAIIIPLAFILDSFILCILITPLIMLMLGQAQFATAKICNFKPFRNAAIVFWLGALACAATLIVQKLTIYTPNAAPQFLILAVCMILGFVVPGYNLNCKVKKNV